MGTNWKDQQALRKRAENLLRHFCGECTSLRAEADESCLDCGSERPRGGWAPVIGAYDPFLGRILNERYLISKIEGRGSSSTIYRAESLTVPKRFAIKMVKLWHAEEGVTAAMRTRLEREVRAVGMLRNPHIVRVYELLELNENWIALVMDHIEGETVEQRIDQDGPFEVDPACEILFQVVNGLCEAHQVGMIHRDIKPANIMLERLPDGEDFAYVLDFGVVRLDGEAKMTHGFLGTPLFASPEQATDAEIDRRSDIYSLGATFFYMLTGRPPFESQHTLDVLEAHVRQPAPTLSETCPQRDFPTGIERLVAAMLAKSPANRPSDLLEVIEALRNPSAIVFDEQTDKDDPTPAESATLTNGLAVENSCHDNQHTELRSDFSDRPKTALGLSHAPADSPRPCELEASEQDRDTDAGDTWRQGCRSGQVTALNETNPHGFERPATNPHGTPMPRDIEVKQTVQLLPADELTIVDEVQPNIQREEVGQQQKVGFAFARKVRLSSASSESHIAFVDTHNELWTVGEGELVPMTVPGKRVTSVATSETGIFLGMADGAISVVRGPDAGLGSLFCDEHKRALTSMAATRSGNVVLAGTSDGGLFLGRLRHPQDRWLTLASNQQICAVGVTDMGGLFAAASAGGDIRVASTEAPTSVVATLHVDEQVADMAFSNDGHLLAVLLADGRVPIFQVLYGSEISVLEPDCPTPQSIYFSRDNILYGVCTGSGRIARWNLTTGLPAAYE